MTPTGLRTLTCAPAAAQLTSGSAVSGATFADDTGTSPVQCAHLTRAQADSLGCWWCPTCISNTSNKSQVPNSVLGDTRRLPASQSQPTQPSPTSLPQSHQSPPSPVTGGDLALYLARLKEKRPVARRVPRGARITAAEALVSLLENAIDTGTAASWTRLLCFPYHALSVPSQQAHTKEDAYLTTKVKRSIAAYMNADACDLSSAAISQSPEEGAEQSASSGKANNRHQVSAARKSGERLNRCVSLKLQDGDVRGAIRLLASADHISPRLS